MKSAVPSYGGLCSDFAVRFNLSDLSRPDRANLWFDLTRQMLNDHQIAPAEFEHTSAQELWDNVNRWSKS